MARWQNGDVADCKSVNAGSIPARASKLFSPLHFYTGRMRKLRYDSDMRYLSRALLRFVRQIAILALAVGLVLGIILFSILLYISDFGVGLPTTAPAVASVESPTYTEAELPAPAASASPITSAQPALEWIFGKAPPPQPAAPPMPTEAAP